MKQKIFYLLCLCSLIGGCAPLEEREQVTELSHTRPSPTGAQIDPGARELFIQAEAAFEARQYPRAIALYRSITRRSSSGQAKQYALYRLGTLYYAQGSYQEAAQEFDAYLREFPQTDLSLDITYNLAACEFQLGNYSRAHQLLSSLSAESIQSQGADRAALIYQLRARLFEKTRNYSGAALAYAQHLELPMASSQRQDIVRALDRVLSEITTEAELRSLLSHLEQDTARALVEQRLTALASRSVSPGEWGLRAMSGGQQLTPEQLEESANRLGSGTDARVRNIGVILPLTGKWANLGKQVMQGILLGSQLFSEDSKSGFEVFFRDSGSNPVNARNAVDELFYEKKVVAILGPLSEKESVAVAKRSQDLGVTNLSLYPKDGLSIEGGYIFQNALTPRVQLEGLVRYCIEKKGFKRFAILAPDDGLGTDMTNAFWDNVERMGGKIVGYQTYKPNETDFQAPIRELTGLANPKLRELEVAKLNEYLQAQKDQGVRNPKGTLPPIVDFSALFIPDTPKVMGQIAPSLAFLDVVGPALLGTAEWNNEQLYNRAGNHVVGALFPAGLNMSTQDPMQKEFISAYTESFGKPSLLAAQGYEAIRIVMAGVAKMRSSNRRELPLALYQLKDFDSGLGKITFDSTRVAKRQLSINTLAAGGKAIPAP